MIKPILYMSLRSPFARRVRLALEELGVDYATETLDVFNPPAGYLAINPLGRVPVLKTDKGSHIIDSWAILGYLKDRHRSHPLFLTGGSDGAGEASLSGLAVGIMEHTVAAYLERLRGPGVMSHEALDECLEVLTRALGALEHRVATMTSPFLTGGALRQCDLDAGAAIGYVRLRFSRLLEGRPALGRYLEHLHGRESFRKTVPPA